MVHFIPSFKNWPAYLTISLFFIFLSINRVFAENTEMDLTNLSLEDLMNVEVYSAAKKEESIFDTAAAISVITSEDIRRSGATNIPDVLRMVPGIRVLKINSHSWDISIRGFNGSTFANKLLVLIDGRSVYTPLYGGVNWILQDVVLEDVERIEVIRGPGGTLWGANAVNGVINIITKKAKDTQGTLISTGGGTEERGFATARYGGTSGDWFYRSYAKYFNRDEGFQSNGTDVDNWDMAKAGFRAEKDKLTLEGEFYELNSGQRATLTNYSPPYTETFKETGVGRGGHLLSTYAEEDWFFKMYWDVTVADTQAIGERRDQIELEYTRQLHLNDIQDIMWGLGYRLQLEDMNNTVTATINEGETTDQLFSLFIQDEIKASEKLKFIVGSKFERNTDTGIEIQPNVRALYHLTDTSQIWAAASRAVRTPSRLDTDGQITAFLGVVPPPAFRQTLGSENLKAETMRAFEMGYRNQPNKKMMFDIAAFSDFYDDLIGQDYGRFVNTNNGSQIIQTIPTANAIEGEVHGIELSTDIQLKEWWKVKAYYSFIKMRLTMAPDFRDVGLPALLNQATPVHSSYVRSSFNLPHGFELDTTFHYTSRYYVGLIHSVAELDVNLGKTIKGWQVAFVGQNLIERHHKESILSATATQVERSWYLKVTREF